MKTFLALLIFSSAAAHAMPYTCESLDQNGEAPFLRLRINDKVKTQQNGRNWKLHLVGVTSDSGERQIVYGSGAINESHINLSFVKQGWVVGKIEAYSQNEAGIFEGEAFVRGVNGGKYTTVRCTK